ncbi:Ribosomal small subunit pseudouridine synthase A [Richelia intracellularis HH01]|uniref:Pseudouridine synthase n=1 Tax=Richelia intracellularis HH01 TaxID=1165094 RepID=M1X0D3_9NOST|nr:pseudouridine synthase [Richelia intracellularis]CCH67458.1 Ribosomal small subunit pseudouridine synthase A [Richelia intracellularis HH01]
MEVRLHKILAQWGIASRRKAEEMIRLGRVCVNGNSAYLGQKVNPKTDIIAVDDNLVSLSVHPEPIYLLLNKPAGIVTTCDDPRGRTTVIDLLPESLQNSQGIHPVGRLDVNSTGALILTNDGELTYHLTHPSHSIPKTYDVVVQGNPTAIALKEWSQGILLDGRKTRPAIIRCIDQFSGKTRLEIVLKEGRNRQIRRLGKQLGYPVISLHRTAIGMITLNTDNKKYLKAGQYRYLQDFELCFLKQAISIFPY